MNAGDSSSYQIQLNSEYHSNVSQETDCGGEAPWSRGKEPRSSSKVPKYLLSVIKGSVKTITARMLA